MLYPASVDEWKGVFIENAPWLDLPLNSDLNKPEDEMLTIKWIIDRSIKYSYSTLR